jgi:DNA polymerase-3 subunit epsilon
VETTGLDPWSGDRVCEVALVRFIGEVETDRLATLVNPLRAVSPGAYRVNGITTAMLAGAPPFRQVSGAVQEILARSVVVAHNASFDVGFIGRELGLAGLAVPTTPVVDTLALARRGYRFASNSLGSIAARLGVSTPGHRALADALTTREVFRHFVADLFPLGARVADVRSRQGGTIPWPAIPTGPVGMEVPLELSEAVESGQTLSLWYVSADGERTRRLVDPVELAGRGGTVSLVAYCHLRQEQRSFRLDRIERWEVADRPTADTGGC